MPNLSIVLGVILLANGTWWELRQKDVALERDMANRDVAIHLHSADVYLVNAYTSPADAKANLHNAAHENEIAFMNMDRARNAEDKEKLYKSIAIGSFASGGVLIINGLIQESKIKMLHGLELQSMGWNELRVVKRFRF